MKRHLIALISLLYLMPLCASAQWYLFPGSKNKEAETTQTTAESEHAAQPGQTAQAAAEAQAEGETSPTDPSYEDEFYTIDLDPVINVALILPIQASSAKPNSNFLEMYSGALMAARDLGNEGLKIDLQVIDSGDGKTVITQEDIDGNDIIIGPVNYNEIVSALDMCGRNKYLISPLEPKAETLAGAANLIQSPVPWSLQIDEMVKWLKQDMQAGDEIIVLTDSTSVGSGEQSAYLLQRLSSERLNYSRHYSIPESVISKLRHYRVLIASDRDSYISYAARNVGIAAARFGNITLYSTARVRNVLGANVADLHNAKAHITAAYFIDYDSPEVKKFILAYRSLFQSEPGAFAFQGYDALHYYVGMYSRYGRRWYRRLPEYSEAGLQSDFRFDYDIKDGRLNTAVRRIIYHSDLSTTVEK